MNAVLAPPEGVGHIPKIWMRLVGYIFATLDILHGGLRRAIAATGSSADGCTGHSATHSCQVLARSTAHLMPEDATNHGSGYCPGHI